MAIDQKALRNAAIAVTCAKGGCGKSFDQVLLETEADLRPVIEAYLAALPVPSQDRLEAVARAICAADKTAPNPDAPIQIGMKPAKAWQGRIEMAQAAIAALEGK